ncbi:MAG: HAD hydrolase-like protein [Candidatus Woesearchaeota archaeon]
MDKLFIFDLDDTLIHTDYKYIRGYAEAICFITNFLGKRAIHLDRLLGYIHKIDEDAIKHSDKPYSIERFPKSICYAFGLICQEQGVQYKQRDLDNLAEIVTKATFNVLPQDTIEGAYETLEFLVSRHDKLALLTKGEKNFQMSKIEICGLNRWFSEEDIFVSEVDKSPSLLLSIIKKYDITNKDKAYSVGNYFRSDIKPAFEAGIKSIYIPNGGWRYDANTEGIEEALNSGRVLILKRIDEIIKRYEEL